VKISKILKTHHKTLHDCVTDKIDELLQLRAKQDIRVSVIKDAIDVGLHDRVFNSRKILTSTCNIPNNVEWRDDIQLISAPHID